MHPPNELALCLQARAEATPHRLGFRFSDSGIDLDYREIASRVPELAVRLRTAAPPGDRVVLARLSAVEFVTTFLACQYASLVAVPVGADARRHPNLTDHPVVADCAPTLIVPADGIEPIAEPGSVGTAPAGTALLQYTSGSTGTPAG